MIPTCIQKRASFLFFLSAYLVLCAFIYKDFGISWDEYDCYSIGSALFHYLVGNGWNADDFLVKVGSWDNGWNPNFWIPYDYWYTAVLYGFNRGFSIELFHWMNMVLASAMFWGAYEVLLDVTGSPWGALGGPLALLWTPRLMGYIPMNPRDGAFAVFFFIGLVGIYFWGDPTRSESKRGWLSVLGLGLLIGMAQSARLVGLILYPLWGLYGMFCILKGTGIVARERLADFKRFIWMVLLAAGVAHLFMALTWPYIRADFFRHYAELLGVSAHFPSTAPVLFMGHKFAANALPWYYLPVWIWISTPLVVLIPAVLSPFVLYPSNGRRLYFLLVPSVLTILVLWIVIRPVIYGDCRHFLFVLPPLAVLSGWTLWTLFGRLKEIRTFWLLAVVVILGASGSMVTIIRLHPYEYIYLNGFVGGIEGSVDRYPTELVGCGFKECALWLGKTLPPIPGKVWKVNALAQPFQTIYYLPKHIKWSEFDEADFFVAFSDCNGFYDAKNRFRSLADWVPIHEVQRCGVPLFYIFKRKTP